MRFLPRVRACMDRQSGSLDEALVAVGEIAAVWTLVGVYSEVSAEI